ncbi:MAG: hypothetical protein ABIX46_06355 [Burkholderiaceae bacterium]
MTRHMIAGPRVERRAASAHFAKPARIPSVGRPTCPSGEGRQ